MNNLSKHILRIVVSMIFISHGAIRAYAGTVANFGEFLDARGFPFGLAIAWSITVFELTGGTLMAANRFTRFISIGFVLHQVMGISLVHINYGWFVVGHGTGGMEYSVLILTALFVIFSGSLNQNRS